jgi:polyphenol oxidase
MPQETKPNILPFKLLSQIPGFFAFTTTRQGGVSQGPYASLNLGLHVGDDAQAVLANRQSLLPHLKQARPVCMQQVHGVNILKAGQAQAGKGWDSYDSGLKECDGLFTGEHGLALAVGVADCLAVVVVDPKRKVLGVAHAGWRGALAGLAGKLVRALKQDCGCDPKGLLAGLSPCLGPCCLELDEEPWQEFEKAFPPTWDYRSPLENGHFKLDLWKLASLQLVAQGLDPVNIETQAFCTQETPDMFFSHRRDNGKTGRMLVMAGFREKTDIQYVF